MAVIKGQLYSFFKDEPLKHTVLRNLIAIGTISQEEYDSLVDHNITEKEKIVLDEMWQKGILLRRDDGATYSLTSAGQKMIQEMIQ